MYSTLDIEKKKCATPDDYFKLLNTHQKLE